MEEERPETHIKQEALDDDWWTSDPQRWLEISREGKINATSVIVIIIFAHDIFQYLLYGRIACYIMGFTFYRPCRESPRRSAC